MSKIFHWVLVILLFKTAIGIGNVEPSEKTVGDASTSFLKAVMKDVLNTPETAKYFPDLKLNDVSGRQNEWGPGWIYRWSYEHDVQYVSANVQSGRTPVFENGHSIIFYVTVTYKNPGSKVWWIKKYKVLEKPELTVSLFLDTGDKNAPLQKIDEIIKSHLAVFQKAVAAP